MPASLPVILVIDDERNTREGLQDAFSDKYQVLLANDALQGMETLKKRKVDIVLTDLRMLNSSKVLAARMRQMFTTYLVTLLK